MENSRHPVDSVPSLVGELYALVAQFEALFPGRRFTPDGHLVGSIGEVIAAHRYGLELLAHSAKGHDARSPCGALVEIKATQGRCLALREQPNHLIVLHLSKLGEASEIYNGPGAPAWAAAGAMQRNGQRPVSIFKLRALMALVPEALRLPECVPNNSFKPNPLRATA
ncbi:MAG: hypothetical protein M3485_05230 [Pseudomonadota bacterium]|nr:hypothetical protein [Pseudomonadota bacterium]